MLSSAMACEKVIREYVRSRIAAGVPYAYEMEEGLDLSELGVGELFKQSMDFWLFEVSYEAVRRAGPGHEAPRRYWGTLDLSLFTQAPRDKVRYGTQLEEVANWFQDSTINGIRFRSFVPTPAVPIRGFTSYNGVINFEFEINIAR